MGLERQLSAADTARQDADRRHASELADAAVQLASLQTRYDTAVTEHAAAQAASEQRLTDAATEHQQAEARAAAALACRVGARGRTRRAARAGIRRAAGSRPAARLRTGGGCSAARLAPGEVRHGRHGTRCRPGRIGTAVDRRRDGASANGGPHRRRLALSRRRARRNSSSGSHKNPTRGRHSNGTSPRFAWNPRAGGIGPATSSPTIVGTPASRRCSSRLQLSGERTHADRRLQAKEDEIRQVQQQVDTLQRLLGTTQHELQDLHGTVEAERLAHERARLTSESELLRVSAEYGHSPSVVRSAAVRVSDTGTGRGRARGGARKARGRRRRSRPTAERTDGTPSDRRTGRPPGARGTPGDAPAGTRDGRLRDGAASAGDRRRCTGSLTRPEPTPKRCAVWPSAYRISRRNSNGERTKGAGNSSAHRTHCAGARRAAKSPTRITRSSPCSAAAASTSCGT